MNTTKEQNVTIFSVFPSLTNKAQPNDVSLNKSVTCVSNGQKN